jgi:hypothetical protein
MHESRNRAISAAVIWHIISFGQKYTERPIDNIKSMLGMKKRHEGVPTFFPPKIPACILNLVGKVPGRMAEATKLRIH